VSLSEGKTTEKAWVNYSPGLSGLADLKEYVWLSTNTTRWWILQWSSHIEFFKLALRKKTYIILKMRKALHFLLLSFILEQF
jgi:hypothetical protein